MLPKIKATVSFVLGVLLLLYTVILFFVVFLGGFSVVMAGQEVSATSAGKPAITLLVLYLIKLFVADFRKEIEKNMALFFGALLVMIFGSEILARAYYHSFVPQDLFWAAENLVMKRTPDPGRLFGVDTIKVSNNRRITFELIPGVNGQLTEWPKGKLLRINKSGFRDDENKKHSKEKGTFRIVGIGDSVMMGMGVDFEDTYGEVVERELNLRSKENKMDVNFEFINLAVHGYNTTMEVETFFQKGIPFDPDLVVISYVPNDFDLPNFIIKKEDPWVSKKSFAVFYINKRLEILANTKYGKFLGNAAWQNQKQDRGVWGLDMALWRNAKEEFVPDDYKFMVGMEAYVREMKRLKQKCDEMKIPLVLVFDVPEEKVVENRERIAIQTARELNIPVIKDYEEVRAFLKEQNTGPEFFCILSHDCHPNKWGHLIKGKKLASFIYDNYITSN